MSGLNGSSGLLKIPHADPAMIEGFLRDVVRDDIQLTAITPDTRDVTTQWFGDDVEAAVAWAVEENDLRRGLYWTANRSRPMDKKPHKHEMRACRFIHGDLDAPKDGSAWDKAGVLAKLAGTNLLPTCVIDSGGGLQPLWELDEDSTEFDLVEGINRGVAKAFDGGDHCHNHDRVLRLPGTVNWPDKVKKERGRVPVLATVALLNGGLVQHIGDMLELFPPLSGKDSAREGLDYVEVAEGVTADSLGLPWGDRLRTLIDEPDGGDRSNDVFACACEMSSRGYSVEEMLGVLLNPDNAVSAHCLDQGQSERAAARAVGAALARPSVKSDRSARAEWKAALAEGKDRQPPEEPPGEDEVVPYPEPFPGFMAEVCREALATATIPQKDMTTLVVHMAMASVIGGVLGQPDGLRHNAYALGITETGRGKDHLSKVASTIAHTGGVRGVGRIASGPGLEDEIVADQSLLVMLNEAAHFLGERVPGNQHMTGVEGMLLDLFTASNGAFFTRSRAGKPARRIAHPYVNLLAFGVPTKVGEALTTADAESGLLNRFMCAMGDPDARPNFGNRGVFVLPSRCIETIAEVRQFAARGRLEWTREGAALRDRLEEQCWEQMRSQEDGSPKQAVLMRSFEKLKRGAGVQAVYDTVWRNDEMTTWWGETIYIDVPHLEWAAQSMRASDTTMAFFMGKHMHGGRMQSNAAKLVEKAKAMLAGELGGKHRPGEAAALAAGVVPQTLLTRYLNIDKNEMRDAVDYAAMRGDIAVGSFEFTTEKGNEVSLIALRIV